MLVPWSRWLTYQEPSIFTLIFGLKKPRSRKTQFPDWGGDYIWNFRKKFKSKFFGRGGVCYANLERFKVWFSRTTGEG